MPVPESIAGSPEFVPEWDVLRDDDGKPITISAAQLRAIWRAIDVVERVRRAEGSSSLWAETAGWGSSYANLLKSRLLGRMLLEGKPPTRTRPPVEVAGPAWWSLPGGDPF